MLSQFTKLLSMVLAFVKEKSRTNIYYVVTVKSTFLFHPHHVHSVTSSDHLLAARRENYRHVNPNEQRQIGEIQ